MSEDFEYEENDELYTPDDESNGRKIGNRPTKPGKDTPWKATSVVAGNEWIGKLTVNLWPLFLYFIYRFCWSTTACPSLPSKQDYYQVVQ